MLTKQIKRQTASLLFYSKINNDSKWDVVTAKHEKPTEQIRSIIFTDKRVKFRNIVKSFQLGKTLQHMEHIKV